MLSSGEMNTIWYGSDREFFGVESGQEEQVVPAPGNRFIFEAFFPSFQYFGF